MNAQQVVQPPSDTTSYFYSPIHKSCVGRIISTEHEQLTQNFTINVVCYFFETTTIDSIVWKLPDGWAITLPNNNLSEYYGGDSLLLSFILSIPDTGNLPFYPQYIEMKLLTNEQDSSFQTIILAGKVYFTPYNTIEIWNIEDFYDLKRYWLPEDSIAPQRIYIPRENIPVSNLGNDISIYERDSSTWDDWWIDDFREVEVEGLAYRILMTPVPYDSLEYYYDIFDEENTGEPMQKAAKTFTGTVKGRITSTITNDFGTSKTISLAGLEVQLRDKDGLIYENFGTAYTDENGYYTISYSKGQTIFEGNKVELYLRIFARTNSSYAIQSKTVVQVYYYDKYIGDYETSGPSLTDSFNISINGVDNADAYRSVHWARKSMKYFRDNSVYISGGLNIKINSSMGSGANNYIYWKFPAIHLETGDGVHENTIYHEFGHYAMYRLQNNNIKIPYAEEDVSRHWWEKENTGLLAWTEAWADAVQMILDAAYWQEDGEYGLDEDKKTFENLRNYSTDNINNGFRSEYHIATAIYDLWDGANKGLPERIPNLNIHGWDDSETTTYERYDSSDFYSWKSIDDVELTLAQICAPLQTITTSEDLNNLRNIGHYYNKLLAQLPDCKDRADVSRVFRENRVLWNIEDYENELYIGNLSSDNFSATKHKSEIGKILSGGLWDIILLQYSFWTDHYDINIPAADEGGNYYIYATSGTDLVLTDNYWIGHHDLFYDLYINSENDNNTNDYHGDFYTCGGNEILVRNGRLELGKSENSYAANLTINENSFLRVDAQGELILNNNCTLYIASGGTLYLKSSSYTELRGNASIIIEDGGYICIEDGARINLRDVDTKINLLSGVYCGLNPSLNISSFECQSVCDYLFTGEGIIWCDCIPFTYDTMTIGSNLSFYEDNYAIKDILIIRNNATVTFTNSTLFFYENARVIVEPGSKLILDGSTFTNACHDVLWQGIVVEGNPLLSQGLNTNNQGVVELRNGATIENAVCGISAGSAVRQIIIPNQYIPLVTYAYYVVEDGLPFMDAYGGGIIKAEDALFINNKKSIHINPYIYSPIPGLEASNSSSFTNCTFKTDNHVLFSTTNTDCQVRLVGVKGICFRGCTFVDERPALSSSETGIGISANDAGIKINSNASYALVPPYYQQPCTFSGYHTAILIKNSVTKETYIRNSSFSNNHISFKAEGITGVSIGMCDFYNSQNSAMYNSLNGVILDNCNQYVVENNTFHGNGVGLLIKGNNEANHWVKNNSFYDMCLACCVDGIQGSGILLYGELTGLQFKCNHYYNNDEDIRISENSRIRIEQGSYQHGAGNLFGNPISTININNIEMPLLMYYYYNAPYHAPQNNPNYISTMEADNMGCSEIGFVGENYYPDPFHIPVSEINNQYLLAKDVHLALQMDYQFSYSNTPLDPERIFIFHDYQQNPENYVVTVEHNHSCHPDFFCHPDNPNHPTEHHVCHPDFPCYDEGEVVITDLGEYKPEHNHPCHPDFPCHPDNPQHSDELHVCHPDFACHPDNPNYQQPIDPSYPQYELFLQIMEAKNEVDRICTQAIHFLLAQEEFDRNEYNLWLERSESLYATYALAKSHLEVLNINEMNTVLTNIANQFPCSYSQEVQDYATCLNAVADWKIDPETFVASGGFSVLNSIISGNNYASLTGEAILDYIDPNHRPPAFENNRCNWFIWTNLLENNNQDTSANANNQIEKSGNISSSKDIKSTTDASKIENQEAPQNIDIEVIPNPATDVVTIRMIGQAVNIHQITLHDMYGKQVYQLNTNNDNVQINISALSKGVYIISCRLENGQNRVKKLVKK